jgi:hypothetical protein
LVQRKVPDADGAIGAARVVVADVVAFWTKSECSKAIQIYVFQF